MILDLMRSAIERSGYGQMGAGLYKAFRELGVAVRDSVHKTNESLRPLHRLFVHPPHTFGGNFEGQEVSCFTMWESSRVTEYYTEYWDNFSAWFVPNAFNYQQWKDLGADNVHIARLGIDPSIWKPLLRPMSAEFCFFSIGGHGNKGTFKRKGVDIAQAAFALAFPDPDNLDPKPVYRTLFTQTGSMTDAEMVEAYRGGNCYVGPSRGEGWNMLAFQALATGMPVVLSDIPGHREFSWLAGAYPIPTQEVVCEIGGAGDRWSGMWWEADVEKTAEAMGWVYQNYAQALREAAEGANYIRGHMTWTHTAKTILDVLEPSGTLPADVAWQEPTVRSFPVVLKRTLGPGDANIGGRIYTGWEGQTIEVSADALRVLLHSGSI